MNKEILHKKYRSEKNGYSLIAIDYFEKVFFWDCVAEKIRLDDDYDLVIERVLSRSNQLEADIEKLDSIYRREIIKEIIKERNGQIFGNEQIEKIAKHYNLKNKDFRRYYNTLSL